MQPSALSSSTSSSSSSPSQPARSLSTLYTDPKFIKFTTEMKANETKYCEITNTKLKDEKGEFLKDQSGVVAKKDIKLGTKLCYLEGDTITFDLYEKEP
jgi:hypothetical protein